MSQKNELPLARKKRTKKLPYLLIAPAILLFCAFTFYPFIRAIVLSFAVTDKRGNFAKWVGIGNWLRVLKKDEFWNVVVVTLKMAAANLVFTFSIAMIFALLATKKVRWSKLYQTMYALPMAIASSPAAAIFLFFFSQHNGVLNNILGTDISWLTTKSTAFWCVVAMTVWQHIGTSFIFLLVGFRNVPEDLLESAWLDGAGRSSVSARSFSRWPLPDFLRAVSNINNSFKCFNQIKLLTQGGPANSTKDADLLHLRKRYRQRPFRDGMCTGHLPVPDDLYPDAHPVCSGR